VAEEALSTMTTMGQLGLSYYYFYKAVYGQKFSLRIFPSLSSTWWARGRRGSVNAGDHGSAWSQLYLIFIGQFTGKRFLSEPSILCRKRGGLVAEDALSTLTTMGQPGPSYILFL